MVTVSALPRLLVLAAALLASHSRPGLAQSEDDSAEDLSPREQAYINLSSRNYQELERALKVHLDAYAARKIPEAELASKFSVFYRSYGLESRFDEWVSAFPRSYSARLARGIYLISDAWRRRGNRYADQTTDNQFQELIDTMKRAASDLQASLGMYERPVESYRYLIMVSMALGLPSTRGLLDAALKLDPEAYFPRSDYLEAITPKWGGSTSQMDAFLEECKRSPMSDADKTRLEARYHLSLGGHEYMAKRYLAASGHYEKAYQLGKNPNDLYWSAKSMVDGGYKGQALTTFTELVNAHPQYQRGYTGRGYLYEKEFKNDEKAFKDYLAAAELGNSWAQNRVGWWYMTGKYVAQDYAKARDYLNRAASQNNKTAIANLKNLDKIQKSGAAR